MRCFAGGFSTLSTGLSTSSVGLRRQLPLKGKPGKTRCGGIGASGTPPPTARIARPARLSRRAGIAGSGACFGYTMPRAAQLLKIRAAVNSQSLCDTPPQPFLGEDTSGSAVLSAERTALPLEFYTLTSCLWSHFDNKAPVCMAQTGAFLFYGYSPEAERGFYLSYSFPAGGCSSETGSLKVMNLWDR